MTSSANRDARPWVGAGLHFSCTQCGTCCTGGTGYTWVTPADVTRLASHLGLALDDFGRRALRRAGGRLALLEDSRSGDCVFLKGNRCAVYEARPDSCRRYPFWPQHLASPEAWAATARACEGIRPDTPLVPLGDIRAPR